MGRLVDRVTKSSSAQGLRGHQGDRSSSAAVVTLIKEGEKKNGVGDAVFRLITSAHDQEVRMFVRDMAAFKGRGAIAAKEIDQNKLRFKILLTGDGLDTVALTRIRAVSEALGSTRGWESPDGWYRKPVKFLRRDQNIRYVIVDDSVVCITGRKLSTSAILIQNQETADWFTKIFETDWESPEAITVPVA